MVVSSELLSVPIPSAWLHGSSKERSYNQASRTFYDSVRGISNNPNGDVFFLPGAGVLEIKATQSSPINQLVNDGYRVHYCIPPIGDSMQVTSDPWDLGIDPANDKTWLGYNIRLAKLVELHINAIYASFSQPSGFKILGSSYGGTHALSYSALAQDIGSVHYSKLKGVIANEPGSMQGSGTWHDADRTMDGVIALLKKVDKGNVNFILTGVTSNSKYLPSDIFNIYQSALKGGVGGKVCAVSAGHANGRGHAWMQWADNYTLVRDWLATIESGLVNNVDGEPAVFGSGREILI